jgi:long-chain acyl-CoA synthetase
MTFNLAIMLRESALAAPEKTVIRFGGQGLSYAGLDDLSDRFAAGLRRFGYGRGEVVAVQVPNLPQFAVAYFGTLKAGLTFLPLNPLLKAPEISYHLTDSSARLLVAFSGMIDEAVKSAADLDVPLFAVSLPGLPAPDGVAAFEELLAPVPPGGGDIEPTGSDDTAVLVYTSGTTGRPKGAELTHFQLFMNCTVSGELFGYHSGDVSLAVLPFFHIFGLSSVLNLAVRFGATLAVVPRFEAKAVLDAIEADDVTVIAGVPTMLQALADADLAGRDLSRLRVAVSGGASLPGEILRRFEQNLGVVVLEGYGLSETASTASFNRSAAERKILSIGKPIWGVEMRVVDPDGATLPPGADHIGEIVIRGHNVMKGYHNLPEATAEAFRGGWFHSGDLGYIDEDGFFFVVDRSKDMIIRGGYNVYPREIEEVLFTHPSVAEAAVIGKPDDRLGEEVVAVVVLKPGETLSEADVIAYARERLAAYKYPREVRFADHLPVGPTGKVLKTQLR